MEEDFSSIDAARRMDREALVAIFDRFAVPLYNFAMRICGDPLKADRPVGHRSMDSNLENKLLMDALSLAIKGELTANQRHVIVLRFAEGSSLLETARIVGKAAGSVKVTQNRAIAKLRKVLDLR